MDLALIAAYLAGHSAGEQQGRVVGYDDAFRVGYDEGHRDGIRAGHNALERELVKEWDNMRALCRAAAAHVDAATARLKGADQQYPDVCPDVAKALRSWGGPTTTTRRTAA